MDIRELEAKICSNPENGRLVTLATLFEIDIEKLYHGYKERKDLYKLIAHLKYKIPYDSVNDDQRNLIKRNAFTIMYSHQDNLKPATAHYNYEDNKKMTENTEEKEPIVERRVNRVERRKFRLRHIKPKEPGFYWCNYEYIRVVEILKDPHTGKLYFENEYEDENSEGNLEVHHYKEDIDIMTCKWSEKLEPPIEDD